MSDRLLEDRQPNVVRRDTAFVVVFVGAIVGLAVSTAFGVAGGPGASGDGSTPSVATTVAGNGQGRADRPADSAVLVSSVDVLPGDGTFRVGVEISPGTYWSHATGGEVGCRWSRVSGPSNFLEVDVPNGETFVSISADDVAFHTQGCAPWHKVESQPANWGDSDHS